ncbi:MAG TPA: glycosyltransferase 87 family protein, partial [Candidatus Acidoferrales bacterium]|nr:glycosyltransferase 87 family protein [Candidatus Acidoferrales bacterium]
MEQSPINNKKTALLNLLSGKNAILLLLFAGVAGLRLFYCSKLPVNTGDILRHIYYGLFAAKLGPAAVGHALVELDPKLGWVAWSGLAYNYPVVALLFFTVIAKLSPTIFFVKFVLTFIEAVNATVIFRCTNQIWLALLYWASPISIWWVSHEGQFEPLQNLFVLVALLTLKKRSRLAFVLLALAVQVKLTAIFFVPCFVLVAWRERPQDLPAVLVAFVLGFAPTLLAGFYYPVTAQVMSTAWSTICNPYYWNVYRHEMFTWNPTWLIV